MKKDDHKRENAKRIMKAAGYNKGGAVKEPSGKSSNVTEKPYKKLKDGGYVGGNTPKKRLDKPSRKSQQDEMALTKPKAEKYARGGATKGKGKTTVNVIVTGGQAQPAPTMVRPSAPPMPPPGAAPMPPPGGARPPGLKRGGAVKKNSEYPITDGSGGGEGRLQKAAAAKKTHGGKKRGK